MDKNRELHELLGLCWHEIVAIDRINYVCSCGKVYKIDDKYACVNPDYAADPRLVLREMMKREDWFEFVNEIGQMEQNEGSDMIYLIYILDTTGKLRDLAIEWLKNNKGNGGV